MAKRKAVSATDSSSLELEKALFDLVSGLSMAEREAFRPEIELLHKHVGGTQDMFVDRRKLTWGIDGVARKTLAVKPKKLDVEINWRSLDTTETMTMDDAAKLLGKTRATLAALLHRHGNSGWCFLNENEDVVTVRKIRPAP